MKKSSITLCISSFLAVFAVPAASSAQAQHRGFSRSAVLQLADGSLDMLLEVSVPPGKRASILAGSVDRNGNRLLDPPERQVLAHMLVNRGLAGLAIANASTNKSYDLGRDLSIKLKKNSSAGHVKSTTPVIAVALIHLDDIQPNTKFDLVVSLAAGVEPLSLSVQALKKSRILGVNHRHPPQQTSVQLPPMRSGHTVTIRLHSTVDPSETYDPPSSATQPLSNNGDNKERGPDHEKKQEKGGKHDSGRR